MAGHPGGWQCLDAARNVPPEKYLREILPAALALVAS
jgi:hypothetical protein